MTSERAYLFRHALLRDAAYQLQLPGDRARLHALAYSLIEDLCGGPPPEPTALDKEDLASFVPHATDAFALELARHARLSHRSGRLALYIRRAAEIAGRLFRTEEEAACWVQLAELSQGAIRAAALRHAGVAAWRCGHVREAESFFEQALGLHREVGDRRGEGIAQANLAGVYRETGRMKEAEKAYGQALVIQRAVRDLRGVGITLASMASVFKVSGRVSLAERTYEEALTIYRRIDDRGMEGSALGNLANVYLETGRVELAGQTYERAIAIHRQVGNRRNEGIVLGNLAGVYHGTGRVEQAERALGEALAIAREISDRRNEGVVLGNLAGLYRETGRFQLAERAYEHAIDLHRAVRNPRFEGAHLCELAMLCQTTRRSLEARARWSEGAALLQSLGHEVELLRLTETMRAFCAKEGVPPISEGVSSRPPPSTPRT